MDRCELVNIQVPHTMFADAPVLERLPKETYYRLFAAQLLPREVNRVLYLDPDLVVVHSIDQLYRLDFKGICLRQRPISSARCNGSTAHGFKCRRAASISTRASC